LLFIERGIGKGCGTIRKPFESRSIGDDALRRLIRRFCRAWYVGEVRRRDGSDFCLDICEQLATADDLRLKLHDERVQVSANAKAGQPNDNGNFLKDQEWGLLIEYSKSAASSMSSSESLFCSPRRL
jgi:hypothetical protein